jgi:VWFA-related protein
MIQMAHWRRIGVLAMCGLVVLASRSVAQQGQLPKSEGVIRINVNLVRVDAIVTDSKGKHVTDLTADDFELLQDGKRQTITSSEYVNVREKSVIATPVAVAKQPKGAAPLPPPPLPTLRSDQINRTIAIVVDDLALSGDGAIRVRDSVKHWVDTQMRPGDLVAIIRTSAGMGSLQQFTGDKRMLDAASDLIRFHAGRVGLSSFAPLAGLEVTPVLDTTSFNDQVNETYALASIGTVQYVIQGLRDLPGRKSLILFTENLQFTYLTDSTGTVNVPEISRFFLEDKLRKITDDANRSSVVINAVDPRGVIYTGLTAEDNTSFRASDSSTNPATGQPDAITNAAADRTQQLVASQDGMIELTHRTGGLFIRGNNDIEGALREAADDGDGYYLLAYAPEAGTFNEGKGHSDFHTIEVRLKKPGLKVRSRNGFFGTPDNRAPEPTTRGGQIAKALLSPFGTGSLHARLTTLYSNDLKLGPSINVLLYIDAHDLTFNEELDGNRKGTLDIVAVTFDEEGNKIDLAERVYAVRLPQKAYEAALTNGLLYSTYVPVKKPGAYQMRVVVRDEGNEKVGSATQFLEAPDLGNDRLALSGIVLAEQAKPADAAAAEAPADGDPNGTPAVRIFKPDTSVVYAYQVLNAHADHDKKPDLLVQTRLFRDGTEVFTSQPAALNVEGQQNPKFLREAGGMKLARMAEGYYQLQVIVTDKLAPAKHRLAAQSIDFEIRK